MLDTEERDVTRQSSVEPLESAAIVTSEGVLGGGGEEVRTQYSSTGSLPLGSAVDCLGGIAHIVGL